MPSYETLDLVADAHNPLLGLLWIALVARAASMRRWRTCVHRAARGLLCLFVAYGLAHVDAQAGLWPRLGLDYSTHAAVAVAMVATLLAISRVAGWAAVATFALYVPLMLHQGYHGVGDVLSTAAAVGVVVVPPAWRARRAALGCGRFPPTPAANEVA